MLVIDTCPELPADVVTGCVVGRAVVFQGQA